MGEVARGPGGYPLPLRHRRGPGQLLDERPGEFGGPVEVASPLAEIGPLHHPEVARPRHGRGFERGQEVALGGVGRPLVGQPGEQGHLVAPVGRPPSGKISLLVPAEHARAGRQQGPLAGAAGELVISGSHVQRGDPPRSRRQRAEASPPPRQRAARPQAQAAILAQTYQTRKPPLPATIICSVSRPTRSARSIVHPLSDVGQAREAKPDQGGLAPVVFIKSSQSYALRDPRVEGNAPSLSRPKDLHDRGPDIDGVRSLRCDDAVCSPFPRVIPTFVPHPSLPAARVMRRWRTTRGSPDGPHRRVPRSSPPNTVARWPGTRTLTPCRRITRVEVSPRHTPAPRPPQ